VIAATYCACLPDTTRTLDRLLRSRPGSAVSELRPALQEIGAWTPAVEARLREFDEFRVHGKPPAAPVGDAMGAL
jgi:hypothetical protein